MKPLLQKAKAILGSELLNVFQETYDEKELPDIINEAIRALSLVRREQGWKNIIEIDNQE
jgi:hypothetical protein